MSLTFSDLNIFNVESDQEIELLKTTFISTISSFGPDSWSPFFVFYSTPKTKLCVVQSHPNEDYDEIVTSISEIMNIFSSSSCFSCVLALDFSTAANDELPYDNVFKLIFASNFAATEVDFPYTYDENNQVQFLDDEVVIHENSEYTEELSDVFSIIYTHTHIPNASFTSDEVCSYLTYKNHSLALLSNGSNMPFINFNEKSGYLSLLGDNHQVES